MNKETFFVLFAKIYYLNLKEKNNISLNDFKNWKTNILFLNFFEKVNKVITEFGKKVRPNNKQIKRSYSLFKTVVSIKYRYVHAYL